MQKYIHFDFFKPDARFLGSLALRLVSVNKINRLRRKANRASRLNGCTDLEIIQNSDFLFIIPSVGQPSY